MAAAWRVQGFDRRVLRRREAFEVSQTRQTQAECGETGVAKVGGVNERRRPGAADVEAIPVASHLAQSEVEQKGAHGAKVRRAKADVGDILGSHRAQSDLHYLTF